MITIRGTSHIAASDLAAIKRLVGEEDPDIVAIELDRQRLEALLVQDQSIPLNQPFLALLKVVQDFLGRKAGAAPGSDMLAAVDAAAEHGVPVALIDQNITITLRRLRTVPIHERVKLVGYLLLGLFGLPFAGRGPRLDELPSDNLVREAIRRFEHGFPGLHHVLITERNAVMADRLRTLEQGYGEVLAFVGAGHVEGIIDRLESDG